jgi:hypothetical protein
VECGFASWLDNVLLLQLVLNEVTMKYFTVMCGGGGELAMSKRKSRAHSKVAQYNRTRHRRNLGTEAEPQQIVAQRLLSCLQYPVP